jgi:hypothetical protein
MDPNAGLLKRLFSDCLAAQTHVTDCYSDQTPHTREPGESVHRPATLLAADRHCATFALDPSF